MRVYEKEKEKEREREREIGGVCRCVGVMEATILFYKRVKAGFCMGHITG